MSTLSVHGNEQKLSFKSISIAYLNAEKVTVWGALGHNGIIGRTGTRMLMDVR